ncbi:Protein of unknown function [Noviherbaspirillum humi]|uniref:DUF2971 domain-containing protein n=1 Tax=Noviherbaspirillum humi TaxID=1688639 RepID=A0A239LS26_9BURK|nr:DUF2971 domain-containing protein [Noviherbaspirillum humi]SNT33336.1 Protein of unknown function [Noviherbaspirillum humi]
MLADRLYRPKDGEMLYHYCSPETLLAICSHKTLRFCDLFSMNDFMEMHWGYHIWEIAAGEMIKTVGKELLDDIDKIIHTSGLRALPLAACMSTQGDVLSQWRAYAHDGNGYAIGFNAKKLLSLPVRPLRVSYDETKQVAEVKKIIKVLHEAESEAEVKRSEGFFIACTHLAFDLAAFKNPAFCEEQEIRFLHVANLMPSNNSLRIVDAGGTAWEQESKLQQISFHMTRGTPVAHLDIDFSNRGKEHPISEVVIGPKNESMLPGISIFLETLDIPNVKVWKSKASYR